jgi:hypothetical protein
MLRIIEDAMEFSIDNSLNLTMSLAILDPEVFNTE